MLIKHLLPKSIEIHGLAIKTFKPLKFAHKRNSYALLLYNLQHEVVFNVPFLSLCNVASDIELYHVDFTVDPRETNLQRSIDTIFAQRNWHGVERALLHEVEKYHHLLDQIRSCYESLIETVCEKKDLGLSKCSSYIQTILGNTLHKAILRTAMLLQIHRLIDFFIMDDKLTDRLITRSTGEQQINIKTKSVTVASNYQNLIDFATIIHIFDKANWFGQVYKINPLPAPEVCNTIHVFILYEYVRETIEYYVEELDKLILILHIHMQVYNAMVLRWFVRLVASLYAIFKTALENSNSNETITLVQWIPVIRNESHKRSLALQDLLVLPLPILMAAIDKLGAYIKQNQCPKEDLELGKIQNSHELAIQLTLNRHVNTFVRFLEGESALLNKKDLFLVRLLLHYMEQKPSDDFDTLVYGRFTKRIGKLNQVETDNKLRFVLNTYAPGSFVAQFGTSTVFLPVDKPVRADILVINNRPLNYDTLIRPIKNRLIIADISDFVPGPYQDYLGNQTELGFVPITLKVVR